METGKCPGNHFQGQHLNHDYLWVCILQAFIMDGLASCTYGSVTLQFIFCVVFHCCLILVALSTEDVSDANVSPNIFITVISSSENKGKLIGTLTNSPKASLQCGLLN